MAKKIFWGLWMTVWPAVALIPPLLTAQGPHRDPARDAVAPIVTTDRGATSTDMDAPQATVALDPALEEPQLGEAQRDPFEPKLSKPKTTAHRISQPNFEPAEKTFDAEAFEQSEQLPAVTQETPPAVAPQATRVQTRRPISQLSAQEERAQKLIHERAVIRAKQRQARLAVKQWAQTTPRVIGRTAWQPQLTQPNALAEFDRDENPKPLNYDIRSRD